MLNSNICLKNISSYFIINLLLIIVSMFVFFPTFAFASQTIVIDEDFEVEHLSEYLEIMVDESGELGYEDILSNDKSLKKIETPQTYTAFGFTSSVIWIKINMHIEGNKNDLVIVSRAPLIEQANLTIINEKGEVYQKKSGTMGQQTTKGIFYSTPVFAIPENFGENLTYLMSFQSKSSIFIHLELWKADKYQDFDTSLRMLYGMLLGLMIALLVYNFILYVSMQDITYLYYSIFIFVFFIYQISLSGFGPKYFWPDCPSCSSIAPVFLSGLVIIFGSLFSMSFLNSRKYAPIQTKLISVLALLSFIGIFISFFSVSLGNKIQTFSGFFAVLFIVHSSIIAWHKKFKPAKYFLFAWSFFFVSVICYLGSIIGIIEPNELTIKSMVIGFCIAGLLLSYAMVARIRNLRERSETKLQYMVAKKTFELQDSIATLSKEITTRKSIEEALKNSQMNLLAVLENTNDGILSIDKEYKISVMNSGFEKSFAKAFGIKPYIGKYFFDNIPEDMVRVLKTRFDRALGGERFSLEDHLVGLGEFSEYHREFSYNPIFVDEEIVGVSVFARDISERVIVEQEKRDLNKRLSDIQRLESMSEMAGGIAHDFNNLLTGVIGNAELAKLDIPDDSPAIQLLEDIKTAADGAAGLSQQMLAFSGKGHFILRQLDINALLKSMAEPFAALLPDAIDIHRSLTGSKLFIEADENQIRQVVMNIFSNAIEAIEGKDGLITITTGEMYCNNEFLSSTRLHEELKEGKYAFITIADNGQGMDSKTLDKIFDPFFSTKFTGRGLGLAAVLGIVRGHNGAIKVSSSLKRGTVFQVLIPLSEKGEDMNKKYQYVGKRGTESNEPATILVVDDEDLILRLSQRTLERSGYRVIVANSGQEAIDIFKNSNGSVSAIMLDLTMPVMDGEATLVELQKIRRDAKVLLCSGYNREELVDRFQDKGISGFLQKPFKPNELISAIKKL